MHNLKMMDGKLYDELHPQGIYSDTNRDLKNVEKVGKKDDKKWREDNPKSTFASSDHDKYTCSFKKFGIKL